METNSTRKFKPGDYATINLGGANKGKTVKIFRFNKTNEFGDCYLVEGDIDMNEDSPGNVIVYVDGVKYSSYLEDYLDKIEQPKEVDNSYTLPADYSLCASNQKFIKSNLYKDMNLVDKIRVNIKGEPMKTLIKNEVLTINETLTGTGKELFTDFLYAKFKDEFVADLAPKLEGLNNDSNK